jgi:hypothetical protein
LPRTDGIASISAIVRSTSGEFCGWHLRPWAPAGNGDHQMLATLTAAVYRVRACLRTLAPRPQEAATTMARLSAPRSAGWPTHRVKGRAWLGRESWTLRWRRPGSGPSPARQGPTGRLMGIGVGRRPLEADSEGLAAAVGRRSGGPSCGRPRVFVVFHLAQDVGWDESGDLGDLNPEGGTRYLDRVRSKGQVAAGRMRIP